VTAFPRSTRASPASTRTSAFGWLKAFASGARPHGVMGPVAVRMSEADMKAVAEYAAGLR
jgi:cytochrome c553